MATHFVTTDSTIVITPPFDLLPYNPPASTSLLKHQKVHPFTVSLPPNTPSIQPVPTPPRMAHKLHTTFANANFPNYYHSRTTPFTTTFNKGRFPT